MDSVPQTFFGDWTMRLSCLSLVLALSLVASAEASLQSALNTALERVSFIHRSSPIPEGALFIDPIESTRGEGVFRQGPTFNYDHSTGGVHLIAPPMLGPADEFGVRREYTPSQIRIVGEDYFSEPVTIPTITRHSRDRIDYFNYYSAPLVISAGDPSFAIDDDDRFSLTISDEAIEINTYSFRQYAGIELEFQSLLDLDLDADLFDASERDILPNAIWPFLPQVDSAIPEIHIVIHYETENSYSHLSPKQYSLLAVPQTILDNSPSVPEPSSILLALLALAFQGRSRRIRA